jgi:dTDP-glucose 4,6-dehydratase
MKNWLITGGAGFIGSNFLRHARAATSARLVIFDALTYAGNIATIADLIDGERVRFVHGDIRDPAAVQDAFARHDVDCVVHFAAESHVDRSILGPQQFIETNVNGTMNLLVAAHARWRETRERRCFLHVSSDEVFGTLSPTDSPFHEATPYSPNSPYAASKAASDHLVRAWHHTYGLPAIITNCSNNYGPWQFPEKLIPLMILNAVALQELPVYGDGLQIRDWLHVQDHCTALLSVLEHGAAGETYCIGGDNQQRNLAVVETICDHVDRQLGRQPGTARALIRHVADRPGHDRRYAIDCSKARGKLGWRPQHPFTDSLAEVVAWYLANSGWVDAIRSGEYMQFYERQYRHRLQVGS